MTTFSSTEELGNQLSDDGQQNGHTSADASGQAIAGQQENGGASEPVDLASGRRGHLYRAILGRCATLAIHWLRPLGVNKMPPMLEQVLSDMGISYSEEALSNLRRLLDNRLESLAFGEAEAEIDSTDMNPAEVRSWLRSLPINRDELITVWWAVNSAAARMRYSELVDRYDDLWYPSLDDVLVLFPGEDAYSVLVMSHEEQLKFIRNVIDGNGQGS